MSRLIEISLVPMAIDAHRALRAQGAEANDALDAARERVLSTPCRTLGDVRAKAQYLLEGATADCVPLIGEWKPGNGSNDTPFDTRVKTFLTSLLGPDYGGHSIRVVSASDFMSGSLLPTDPPSSEADRFTSFPLSVSAAITIHHALELHDWSYWTNENVGSMIGDPEEVEASEASSSFVWLQVVKAPCRSLNDVRAKAAYVLSGVNGRGSCVSPISLKSPNHYDDTSHRYSLMTFLRSLLGKFPVEDPRSLPQIKGPVVTERQLLGRIAAELKVARLAKDYDALRLLADELEAVAMHSEDSGLRTRAQGLLDTVFDPIDA